MGSTCSGVMTGLYTAPGPKPLTGGGQLMAWRSAHVSSSLGGSIDALLATLVGGSAHCRFPDSFA
eukprot:3809267-Pyramimonas_sp.AAC.1